MPDQEQAKESQGFFRSISGFGWAYWMLNTIEMWERLAYFSVRSVVAVYIMQADDPGGLHFTAATKGTIYAWWFVFQSILPMFTGGYADRYGYKKTLAFAVTLNIIGYIMMAEFRSFLGFFLGVLVLATGTAFFKPGLQGSLAQSITRGNSSVGWGIFYWLVNIGAMLGPPLAGFLRTGFTWEYVFLASAAVTSLNYLMLLTYKDMPSGASQVENPLQVFIKTFKNLFFNPRLLVFLLIMSGFWLMMYQLWDLHPNFISDWVDSSSVARILPLPDAWTHETDRGVQVLQENLLNLNAFLIVLCIIPVSWAVSRMRTLSTMLIGMCVATGGIIVSGVTTIGWVFLLGVVFFSAGEMLTGPKKNEYLSLIAPPGKKGMYLGYVNIPVGFGGFVGSKMAGYFYGHYGEKAVLALKYIARHTEYGKARVWDGSVATLETAMGIPRTEAFVKLQEILGMDAVETTQLLWNTYNPQYWVWVPFTVIGLISIVSLAVYGQMAKRWKDMNA